MNEVIEQAAVAVAGVLDRPVWALGDADLFAGLQTLEDVVTLARSAQASLLHELTARDGVLRGATSMANAVRDRLRVSAQAGQRMVALGKVLNARPVLRSVTLRGSRPAAVSSIMASQFAVSEARGGPSTDSEQPDPAPGDIAVADSAIRPDETLTGPFPADLVDPLGIAVNAEQALIIGAAINDLPRDLDRAIVDACEVELIKLAALYEPGVLRRYAEHILDYVAPEIAEAALAAKLSRDEAAARRKRPLTITDDGNGSHRILVASTPRAPPF